MTGTGHDLLILLVVLNIFGFALMGYDKWQSMHRGYRVREVYLLGLAGLGGSVGAYLAMKLLRHKTRHKSFAWGLPAIIFLQLAGVLFLSS